MERAKPLFREARQRANGDRSDVRFSQIQFTRECRSLARMREENSEESDRIIDVQSSAISEVIDGHHRHREVAQRKDESSLAEIDFFLVVAIHLSILSLL